MSPMTFCSLVYIYTRKYNTMPLSCSLLAYQASTINLISVKFSRFFLNSPTDLLHFVWLGQFFQIRYLLKCTEAMQRKCMALSQIMWNLFKSKHIFNLIFLISLVILNLFCEDHMPQTSLLADHEVNNHSFWQIHKYNSKKARIIMFLKKCILLNGLCEIHKIACPKN